MGAQPEFDVVVVGGGAAGCVVAARVSQSTSRSVCLLEAGPDLRGALPDEFRDGWHMPQGYDWGYTSEPSEAGAVEKLRRLKLLGGTSFLTRFALRGSPADYDEWRDLGNDGWGFHDVLPYFIKLEADADFGDQPWHGKDGPIPIRRYFDLEPTDMGAAGRAALEAVGFPPIDDHNRPGAVGVGRMPMSSTDGIRTTPALAYLATDETLRNLTIRADSLVSEVVFETNRAVGIRLLDGTEIRAGCVVLCAGTYGSPPILMRSGVGAPDHLRSVGIEVDVPLPGVGSNLSDHPSLDIDCGYRGPCRVAPLLHSIATFHSSVADEAGPPDLMLWMQEPVEVEGVSIFEIDIVLLKPRARGTVRLRSRDPSDPPRIELPIVERIDIARLVEGYERASEVAHRPEVRRLCAEAPPMPTNEELPSLVGASAYSVPHVVGTCAMGSSPDGGAVVDASGRVHGTEHLFVVDASIMPTVPSGFTHIPTIMIAERLSEQISASLA
jgi:choline dehydrogenase